MSSFVKRIYLVVRTSYDIFKKPTYALLKKERSDILRLIVRSFFMKLAPDITEKLKTVKLVPTDQPAQITLPQRHFFSLLG